MTRTFTSLLFTGIAALGLTVANPQTSHAQTPFGLQLNVGPAAFNYQQGYGYGYPSTVAPYIPAPRLAVPAPIMTAPYAGYARPYGCYYPSYRYGGYVGNYRGGYHWHHHR
jgi:hypothetical protein